MPILQIRIHQNGCYQKPSWQCVDADFDFIDGISVLMWRNINVRAFELVERYGA